MPRGCVLRLGKEQAVIRDSDEDIIGLSHSLVTQSQERERGRIGHEGAKIQSGFGRMVRSSKRNEVKLGGGCGDRPA